VSSARETDVAIIGMACIFPGAGDLEQYWRNIVGGYDAIREWPAGRWDPAYYDPDVNRVDRVYCKRGGFIDEFASFDAFRWGVMPIAAAAADPDQLLGLEISARALADAGYRAELNAEGPGREFPRHSTGVILGHGCYVSRGMNRFATTARESEELVQWLRSLIPNVTEDQLGKVRAEFQDHVGHHGPDTVIGIVPNLVASRIANRLDLRGPAYTVDAACASSLVAVERACLDLTTGRSDMVLAGGVHLGQDFSFWAVFSQLGALSRSQEIRPFDRRADGLLMGEGVAVMVLKRRADAERDGDRIYAVIRGTGVSSDGRSTSLMTPSADGQVLALERAWKAAGLDPLAAGSIGLLEAHGTGTPAGDRAELTSVADFFGPATGGGNGRANGHPRAALGTVKSMIGHAMPAAGAAGVIKAALAIHHKTLPPTLHCEEPHPLFEPTRFRPIPDGAEPWEDGAQARRAGINAFGFGGINAHVILEEPDAESRKVVVPVRGRPMGSREGPGAARPQALFLAAVDPEELVKKLEQGEAGGRGPCRLAVIDPTPERRAQAASIVRAGRAVRGHKGSPKRRGIWFTPSGLIAEGGKLAFVFPGVDADFQPRIDDIVSEFERSFLPEAELQSLQRAEELERTGVSIVLVNRMLDGVLRELGVEPDVLCGHSIGEWSGMIAAGCLASDEVDTFIQGLEPGSLRVPGVFFATAGCGRERVEPVLEGLKDIVVSHDNCPHQVLICGREASVDEALRRLGKELVLCQKLDFQSGFHTALFEPFVGGLRTHLERLTLRAPRIPLWSATTLAPYPSSSAALYDLYEEHLVRPIRFRELTDALYEEGVRVFVQVGTGSLVGFLDDTLKGRPHLALTANAPRRTGLEQLRTVLAGLWVEGADVDVGRLFQEVRSTSPSGERMLLDLGTPIVRLEKPLDVGTEPSATLGRLRNGTSPLMKEYAATLSALQQGGADVLKAYESGAPTPARSAASIDSQPVKRTLRRKVDLDRCPYLFDHSFFKQPEGWPDPADSFPVVPFTMSWTLMIEAARELAADGEVVIGLEKVRAFRWMAVDRPLELTIDVERDGDRVRVRIGEFIEGTVVLARDYPVPPRSDPEPFEDEEPLPMTVRELYDDRYMFHGPAYQGVLQMHGIADGGLRGVIEEREGLGCLLDSAGQLYGLWMQVRETRDNLIMPVGIESVTFYGPDAKIHDRFDCKVWIRSYDELRVRADLDLTSEGRLWCRMVGWEDRRFEMEERAWPVLYKPQQNLLSVPSPDIPGACTLRPHLGRVATRDYFARRFLGPRELETYRTLNPRRQIEWLAGRIVAKDAARDVLWRQGHGPIYPIELEIVNEPSGRPRVLLAERLRREGVADLRLSLSHKRAFAAAIVEEGREPGIDVERVTERDDGFEDTTFSAVERALLPGADDAGPGDRPGDRNEWIARFWAAKEAVAKAQGTGLEGQPASFPVTNVVGDRLTVAGWTVNTLRDGDFVVAWTIEEEEPVG
jgi:phosphopantetheine--protein transferase-like protein